MKKDYKFIPLSIEGIKHFRDVCDVQPIFFKNSLSFNISSKEAFEKQIYQQVVIVKYTETQLGFTLFLVSLLESIFGYKVFASLND